MNLPFSENDFLGVFSAYNSALWPVIVVLWAATAALALRCRRDHQGIRSLFVLLAIHWAWSGVIYHWIYFRRINPVATFFGAFFVAQSLVFAVLFFRPRGYLKLDTSLRGILGSIFVVYALLYPLLALYGHEYPRMPVFAVPCPTVLLTAGVLLASVEVPRIAYWVPLLWTAIAGSAAILLRIPADLALFAAGVLLAIDLIAPNALGTRTAHPSTQAESSR